MNDRPSVSIIVNNYNYGCFLRQAIDSALAQTYPEVEVIVVDDGSTDDSREIIRGYGDKIIPIFKPNGGQGSAFNAGFAKSRGEIVIFLDADDVLLPHAVERVAQAWRPGVAKVQYWLDAIDDQGRRLGPYFSCPDLTTSQLTALLRRGYLPVSPPTSGNAFSRNALTELLPMPEAPWRIAADAYLYTLAPFLGEIVTLREPLALYRIHERNSQTKLQIRTSNLRLDFLKDLLEPARKFARRKGFCLPDDRPLFNLNTEAARLVALRAGSPDPPFPEDRARSLFKAALRANLWDTSYG
jgi:glycosyltransferase involved in cell wall biosynthesis